MATPFVDGHQFYMKKNNLLLFKRTKAIHCQLCKKTHDSNNTAYVAVHQMMVVLHCRRSPGHIIIGRLGGVPESEPEVDGFDDEFFPIEAPAPAAKAAPHPAGPKGTKPKVTDQQKRAQSIKREMIPEISLVP